MITRREVVGGLVAATVAPLSGASAVKEQKQLIASEAATKRIKEIWADGGVITSVTIHYSLPAPPGYAANGACGLWGDEVGWLNK